MICRSNHEFVSVMIACTVPVKVTTSPQLRTGDTSLAGTPTRVLDFCCRTSLRHPNAVSSAPIRSERLRTEDDHMPLPKLKNRWLIAASAVGIHLSIGSIYAYSAWQMPLENMFGWSPGATMGAFSLAIFFLGLSAAFLGPFIQKRGPTRGGLLSAAFFCTGLIGAGAACWFESLVLFYLFFELSAASAWAWVTSHRSPHWYNGFRTDAGWPPAWRSWALASAAYSAHA